MNLLIKKGDTVFPTDKWGHNRLVWRQCVLHYNCCVVVADGSMLDMADSNIIMALNEKCNLCKMSAGGNRLEKCLTLQQQMHHLPLKLRWHFIFSQPSQNHIICWLYRMKKGCSIKTTFHSRIFQLHINVAQYFFLFFLCHYVNHIWFIMMLSKTSIWPRLYVNLF